MREGAATQTCERGRGEDGDKREAGAECGGGDADARVKNQTELKFEVRNSIIGADE